jgi:hypothetical protein
MAGMLHFLWVRHNLRPGEFYTLPYGEQQFLLASAQIEMKKLKPDSGKGGSKHVRS